MALNGPDIVGFSLSPVEWVQHSVSVSQAIEV